MRNSLALSLGLLLHISINPIFSPSEAQADAGIPLPSFSTPGGPCGQKKVGDRCDSWYESKRHCVQTTEKMPLDYTPPLSHYRSAEDRCEIAEVLPDSKIVHCLRCIPDAQQKK